MGDTVKLAFTISKEAYEAIKAGKAVLESGGVRMLTGQMKEMAKPVGSLLTSGMNAAALGHAGAAVNIGSSLLANGQLGVLQHSINVTNIKLDDVIAKLNVLSNSMTRLNTIQALSWVTTGFSFANCGISTAGFYMTLKKLDEFHGQLKEFYNQYKQDRENDQVEAFQNLIMLLKGHLGYFEKVQKSDAIERTECVHREQGIERDLSTAVGFLRKVITEFKGKSIDGRVGCQIIFTLSTVLVQTASEYNCLYYYRYGEQHHMYQDWISVIDEIDSPEFKAYLRQYLTFDKEYITVSPRIKHDAYQMVFEVVARQKAKAELYCEVVKQLPEAQYGTLDDLVNRSIFSMMTEEISQKQGIRLDEHLTRQIENGYCFESEENVVIIPLEIE